MGKKCYIGLKDEWETKKHEDSQKKHRKVVKYKK